MAAEMKFFAHTTRRHPISGPFATREEAIEAAFARDPRATEATSGYGIDGPGFDVRWTRRAAFERRRAREAGQGAPGPGR